MKGQSNSVNFEKIRFNNDMNFAEIVNIKDSINLTWMSVESLSLAAVNSSVWRKTQSGFVTTLSLPVWIFFRGTRIRCAEFPFTLTWFLFGFQFSTGFVIGIWIRMAFFPLFAGQFISWGYVVVIFDRRIGFLQRFSGRMNIVYRLRRRSF